MKNLRCSVVKMNMTPAKKNPTPENSQSKFFKLVRPHTNNNAITNALGFMQKFVSDGSIQNLNIPRSGLNSEYDGSLDMINVEWEKLLATQLVGEVLVCRDIGSAVIL